MLLFVDSQIRNINEIKNFEHVDYFFMNNNEKKIYLKKYNIKNLNELISKKNFKNIILKKGRFGISILGNSNFDIKGLRGKKIIDEAGAGDTLLAFFCHLIGKENINLVLKKSNKEAYKMITERKKYVW